MAILNPFKLGRPGAETSFEINPSAVDWGDAAMKDTTRGIDGELNIITLSGNRPTVSISGNYITPAQWNQFRALMMIADTPLNFIYADLTGATIPEVWQEQVVAASTTTLILPKSSALRASKLAVDAGGASLVSMVNIYTTYAAGRTGTTTIAVSSYADTSYTISASGLTAGNTYYVTYQCKALAVTLTQVPIHQDAGWVDKGKYSLVLTGA